MVRVVDEPDLPDHVVEVAPGAAHAALGGDVLLEGPGAGPRLLLVPDVVGVDVVGAGQVLHPPQRHPRVVERQDVLVPEGGEQTGSRKSGMEAGVSGLDLEVWN